MPIFELYKKGQGKYTRMGTLIGVMGVGLIGAYVLSNALTAFPLLANPLARFGVPTVLFIALGVLMVWIVNRPQTADFLIATEGEMKKVSWSSKKEIVGSTKVVIITTLILAAILLGVDVVFANLFKLLGLTSLQEG